MTHELKLMKDYVLIKEEENPFRERKTASGIITSIDSPFVESQETGNMELLERIIAFGVVIGTGPDIKYLKVGDGVYYDRRSIRGIPYGTEPGWHINEANVVGYIENIEDSVTKAVMLLKQEQAAEERKAIIAANGKFSGGRSIEDLIN